MKYLNENEFDMKLPLSSNAPKYKGLYIVNFGDYASIGFTANEVAMLLESQRFHHIKVYKIHNAYPDGRIETKGITNDTFALEQGIFFYSHDQQTAQNDFQRLTSLAASSLPPCRAKVQLAKYCDDKFVTALIFPAEYNDEISTWLKDADYKTSAAVAAGYSTLFNYYAANPEIIQRHQLTQQTTIESRTIEKILEDIKNPFQRRFA